MSQERSKEVRIRPPRVEALLSKHDRQAEAWAGAMEKAGSGDVVAVVMKCVEQMADLADLASDLERELEDAKRALSEGTRWIPVSERLPEVAKPRMVGYEGLSEDVLIYGEGDCDVAARDTLEGGWYSVQRAVYLNESGITHWMPLPEAPQ